MKQGHTRSKPFHSALDGLIGQQVRYVDSKHNFWRNGILIQTGRKWAKVQHPTLGIKRIPMNDVMPLAD